MNTFICYNRHPTHLSLPKTIPIFSKTIFNNLHKFHFIWDPLQLFLTKVIAKKHTEILHFEVIDVIHAKFQNLMNQNSTSLKTF